MRLTYSFLKMKTYNPNLPLIYIHVPKTAGQSVQKIFLGWFPERIRFNYFSEATGDKPKKQNLKIGPDAPVIFGHFNRRRQFGIQDYYPEVEQFLTILRDPFEMHISRFFYTRNNSHEWRRGFTLHDDLYRHIVDGHLNMIEHFPAEMTLENFPQQLHSNFIHIGTVETLPQSLEIMAEKIGRPFSRQTIPHVNRTERSNRTLEGLPLQQLRKAFRDKWPLEHAVYDYANQL